MGYQPGGVCHRLALVIAILGYTEWTFIDTLEIVLTYRPVDDDNPVFGTLVDGLCRANLHAYRLFAVVAGHDQVEDR
jgi:hypothetical protein